MTTAFSLAEVRWLTDPEAPVVLLDHLTDLPHHEIPMPPAMGSGWVEMMHHFSAAFRRVFGYTPGSLRRG